MPFQAENIFWNACGFPACNSIKTNKKEFIAKFVVHTVTLQSEIQMKEFGWDTEQITRTRLFSRWVGSLVPDKSLISFQTLPSFSFVKLPTYF